MSIYNQIFRNKEKVFGINMSQGICSWATMTLDCQPMVNVVECDFK